MSATLVQKSSKLSSKTKDIRLQEQLATYSLLLDYDYDIDSTYDAYEEHGCQRHTHTHTHAQTAPPDVAMLAASPAGPESTSAVLNANAINNNSNNNSSSGSNNNNNTQVPLMQPISVVITTDAPMAATPGKSPSICMPPTPPVTPNLQQNTAQKRWRILAKVLRKDSEETVSSSSDEFSDEQSASVRRFKSFDLLRQDSFEDHMSLTCLGKTENWYKYRMLLADALEYSVNIHHTERQLTASDLMGFNNTGNICVWPSEEALTALVLSDLAAYRGKWILELGGGFTSLAGLMLAKYATPYAVHLTDGNELSVENVRKTVCLNELSCYTKCSVLKWQDVSARAHAEQAKFDTILCADCLFFDEARAALVETIWYYLAPHGVALIMAPRRGKTLNLFREECLAKGFAVEVMTRYNETIWQRHLQLQRESDLYVEDLHYPLLLRLAKLS